jgi:hypothetical protein
MSQVSMEVICTWSEVEREADIPGIYGGLYVPGVKLSERPMSQVSIDVTCTWSEVERQADVPGFDCSEQVLSGGEDSQQLKALTGAP